MVTKLPQQRGMWLMPIILRKLPTNSIQFNSNELYRLENFTVLWSNMTSVELKTKELFT